MVPSSIADVKTRSFWVAVLAELLGTMFLVLVACGACADFIKKENQPRDQVVQIALAFGLSVATIVWVIARVSGGHINPAVTFGFLVTRKISVLRGLLYIMAQCLGSLIGAAILKSLSPSGVNEGLGNCAPQGGTTVIQTFFIEMLITFVLVWTVFATCDPSRNDIKGSGPLAIGLSIAMCHLWAVPSTGSGMNPARVFGPAVVSKLIGTNHWAYWIGPLAGAALAAVLYDFVLAVNATGSKLKGFMTRDYDDTQYDNQGKRRSEHNENIQLKNTA